MIVPFFFTHPRILFSFFLFFAVRNDSEVRIEFSSKSNESIYIYIYTNRKADTRVYNTKKRTRGHGERGREAGWPVKPNKSGHPELRM